MRILVLYLENFSKVFLLLLKLKLIDWKTQTLNSDRAFKYNPDFVPAFLKATTIRVKTNQHAKQKPVRLNQSIVKGQGFRGFFIET